ncbi:CinA family protein [Aliiglaciecola lipolytica]|uniref:Protein ygaD n=1 Tax=Aliiglaciecola lipolytica E3 TaxID=1127673 RepID=K6XVL9_9ALTE|nr:CinA family protein [Aliiglaciecola lipolytica]GAC15711.1 protein ygaD [Aliiglaciecola lipolytica E3]
MLPNKIDSLAKKLGQQLKQKQWTISCAESCTGGGVAFAITSVAGSSDWFKQSFVTYSNEAKQVLLGVRQEVLMSSGAVSDHTVEQMASGCALKSAAEVGVSISGIAGPDGGSDDKPVGLVWFGFFVKGKVTTKKQIFNGDRHQVRGLAIEYALQQCSELITEHE